SFTIRHNFLLVPFCVFLFYVCVSIFVLLSFPTRRSSDLGHNIDCFGFLIMLYLLNLLFFCLLTLFMILLFLLILPVSDFFELFRSEEHTSELQSRFDLVCRLLLEKKNKSFIPSKSSYDII